MDQIKQITERYWKPTPKFWRQIGDSLLAVSSFATGYAIVEDKEWLALTFLAIGVAGKFLTNFFKEE